LNSLRAVSLAGFRSWPVGVLLWGLVSCSGVPSQVSPPPAAPQRTIVADEFLDLSASWTFDGRPGALTYRSDLVFKFFSQDGEGTLTLIGRHSASPAISQIESFVTGSAYPGGGEVFTWNSTQDGLLLSSPAIGCLAYPLGEIQNPYLVFLEPQAFLQGSAERSLPDLPVGGRPAHVYELNGDNLTAAAQARIGMEELIAGRLFLSPEEGRLLRVDLEGHGSAQFLTGQAENSGEILYSLNLFDFDRTQIDDLPRNCYDTRGRDSQYPYPEDAFAIGAMPGFLTYQTGLAIEALIDFYLIALPAQGWTLVEINPAEEYTELLFEDADHNLLQVTLSTALDSESTLVAIFGEG